MNDETMITSARGDSHRRTVRLKTRLAVAICTGVILTLSLAAPFSPAQTTMELRRWKEFSYAKEVKQVGGRMTAIDAVNRKGFLVLGNDEFAQLSSWTVHTSSPEGREFYQGFVMYDFKDGSTILAKVDVSGEPRSRQMGTIVFVAGTKRFKGITGRGTVYSRRPSQWDMYTEIEASYAVPEE